ncbi:MAG: chromate transporter [Acetobacteraceae bacterium]|nr:chromate transporter [Acetobacteraceae bacterium]
MSEPPSAWELARAFNRIALESFGGGLSAWSREVIVRERGWVTDEEFLSASTICRILPGANQVNMAVFVGMKLRGVGGAVAAVIGLCLVPMVIVLAAGAIYLQLRDNHALRNLMRGMTAAAVGLTFSVAWRQGRTLLTAPVPLLLFILSLVMAAAMRAPLWLTLLLLGPFGFAWAWRRETAS